jgi:hypothetical protein
MWVPRRLWRYSAAVIVAATTVYMAAPAAGALSARPVSPDRWTRSVCQDISTWLKARGEAETGAVEALGGLDSGALKPKVAKARLDRAIRLGAQATDGLVKDVKSAGTPQVNNGKQVASAYVQTLADYGKAYKKARTTLSRAKTRDKEQFVPIAQQVNDTLVGDLNAVGLDPVEELRAVPELAAGVTAACGDVAAYLTAKIDPPCQTALNTARHAADVDSQEDPLSADSPQLEALLDEEERTLGQLQNELGACNVPGVPAPCRKPFETAQQLKSLWDQIFAAPFDSPQAEAAENELNRQYDTFRSDVSTMCH